ncbi:signal transduction histidine kinase [Inhella inkyongensis]|uniref:histidine kinase n=1 Tax=Inhella inkyongensis TaxID=392593 RepID=A0A840S9W7_9BURK|nr:ATP-binding protein [Inhella inkyongensis]MBB5205796.1 signal transduction histidine kinase [Inhella inkyongensis]
MGPSKTGAVPLSAAQLSLLQAERLQLIAKGIRQVRGPRFLVDLALSGVAAQTALGAWAWAYLALMTLALWGRSQWMEHRLKQAEAPALTLAGLQRILFALAWLHAGLIAAVFAQAHTDWHYLLTMVMVGNAAGAMATVAGDVKAYRAWVSVYGGALALGWLARLDLQGLLVAGLLGLMFMVLLRAVREQGEAQEGLVRLSDELRQAHDEAQRASASKSRFFSAASHDLRQPLAALSFQVATVQALSTQQNDARLAQVAAGLRRALHDSQSLLNSLLEVSQLDAGAVTVDWQLVNLNQLLLDLADTLRPQAQQLGLQLRCELPEGAPLWVRSDPALLRRILGNLAGNALKFTEKGEICLRLRAEQGQATVAVQDTGPGIAPDLQTRVFEEFFQVNNPERSRALGLGLGLAIVQRLTGLLGTTLKLQSALGEGSCFSLNLALEAPVTLGASAGLPPPQPGAQGLGRRVLVLDDEAAIRDALSQLLILLGWSVRSAADIPEALAQLSPHWQPDALVLDFRLRDRVSGLDALAALRAQGCQAPAWLVTGETSPRRIQQAHETGIPVLYKPIDGLDLATRISSALGQPTPA